MIDKALVKKRFSKSLKTYNDDAVIQKHTAEKLISLLPRTDYGAVLEIGAGTGILTNYTASKLHFKEYDCIDLVPESETYIRRIIPDCSFTSGDIEETALNKKYDLIISNAALQWCSSCSTIIQKLALNLNENGILAASVFGRDNFKELKEILNVQDFLKTDITGIEETEVLYFDNPIDILRHIKNTGANALADGFKFTKSSLKEFETLYRKKFSAGDKVFLTYKPLYFIMSAGN